MKTNPELQQLLPHTTSSSIQKGATFSEDRRYRYSLWRTWDATLPKALWIGLNPSTADDHIDDPTIKKCVAFSKLWNCGGLIMTNLFGIRSTDPKLMIKSSEPIGGDLNDKTILECLDNADIVVAAWGRYGSHLNRSQELRSLLARQNKPIYCLGRTKTDEPRHPLYLPIQTPRQVYSPILSTVS